MPPLPQMLRNLLWLAILVRGSTGSLTRSRWCGPCNYSPEMYAVFAGDYYYKTDAHKTCTWAVPGGKMFMGAYSGTQRLSPAINKYIASDWSASRYKRNVVSSCGSSSQSDCTATGHIRSAGDACPHSRSVGSCTVISLSPSKRTPPLPSSRPPLRSAASSPPPPPDASQVSTLWSVISGASYCELSNWGTCITDGADEYGDDEECTVRAEVAITVSITSLATESDIDSTCSGALTSSGASSASGSSFISIIVVASFVIFIVPPIVPPLPPSILPPRAASPLSEQTVLQPISSLPSSPLPCHPSREASDTRSSDTGNSETRSDSRYVVRSTSCVNGQLSTFNDMSVPTAARRIFAAVVGVDLSAVTLELAPGSVLIRTMIAASSSSQSNAISVALADSNYHLGTGISAACHWHGPVRGCMQPVRLSTLDCLENDATANIPIILLAAAAIDTLLILSGVALTVVALTVVVLTGVALTGLAHNGVSQRYDLPLAGCKSVRLSPETSMRSLPASRAYVCFLLVVSFNLAEAGHGRFQLPSPPPSPPPLPSPPPASRVSTTTPLWSIISGASYCELSNGGTCVTDGPGNYGNSEDCTVQAEVAMTVSITHLDTESLVYDYLTIGNFKYGGKSPISSTFSFAAGAQFSWQSDSSEVLTGWEVCGTPTEQSTGTPTGQSTGTPTEQSTGTPTGQSTSSPGTCRHTQTLCDSGCCRATESCCGSWCCGPTESCGTDASTCRCRSLNGACTTGGVQPFAAPTTDVTSSSDSSGLYDSTSSSALTSSGASGASSSTFISIFIVASFVIFIMMSSLGLILLYNCYNSAQEMYFARNGGVAAMESLAIALPGMSPAGTGRKELRQSQDVAGSKPEAVIRARKGKDFWGLQSVPQVIKSGVKTIDKVLKPGSDLAASVTRSACSACACRSIACPASHANLSYARAQCTTQRSTSRTTSRPLQLPDSEHPSSTRPA